MAHSKGFSALVVLSVPFEHAKYPRELGSAAVGNLRGAHMTAILAEGLAGTVLAANGLGEFSKDGTLGVAFCRPVVSESFVPTAELMLGGQRGRPESSVIVGGREEQWV